MNTVMGLESGMTSEAELELRASEEFEKTMRNLCGFLVHIIERGIYLIHQTAKGFLPRKPSDGPHGLWEHSLKPQMSHFVLGSICMSYLLLVETEHPFSSLISPAHSQSLPQYLRPHRLFKYAASYWSDHFNEADIHDTTSVDVAMSLCDQGDKRFPHWWAFWITEKAGVASYWFPRTSSSPHIIASLFELSDIMKEILNGASSPLLSSDGKLAPLHWAALRGKEAVVRLLLDYGMSPNITAAGGVTPLYLAVYNGSLNPARLLLENGADVKAVNSDRDTALLRAINEPAEEALVKLLLDYGADVNAVPQNCLPLQAAAITGNERIIRLLLENGAVVTAAGTFGQTALHVAAAFDHPGAAELLL